MKNVTKKLLVLLLGISMICGMLPQMTVQASAEELGAPETISEEAEEKLTEEDSSDVIIEEESSNANQEAEPLENEESSAVAEDESSSAIKEESEATKTEAEESSAPEESEPEEDEEDPFDVEIPQDGSVLVKTLGVGASVMLGMEQTVDVKADAEYIIGSHFSRKAVVTQGYGAVVFLDKEGNEIDTEYAAAAWYSDNSVSYELAPNVAAVFVTDMMLLAAPTSGDRITYLGSGFEYFQDGSRPGENSAGVFTTSFGSGMAYCGNVALNIPMAAPGGYVTMGGMQEVTDATIRKVLYYGYGGPAQWSGFQTLGLGGNGYYSDNSSVNQYFGYSDWKGAAYFCTHDVLSGANGSSVRNVAFTSQFKAYIAGQPAAPSGFHVYVRRGASQEQDLFVFEFSPNGKLTLTKSSANASITNNNPCYDLAETTFSVYSDRACTRKVGDLVCKSDGTTNTLELAAGTYYYKETKAGKGYLLDSNVKSVTVTAGKTNTITASNKPGSDPLVIEVSKANANGIDEYDLSGTEFTISYYAGYYNTVAEARASGNPTRKWTIATQKQVNGTYRAMLLDRYLVAGSDQLYKDGGFVTLPLGTIIIEETKAAPGFNNDCILKDSNGVGGGDPYIAHITMTTGQVSLVTTNGVKLDDTNNVGFGATDTAIRGDMEFTKTAGDGSTMAGVEFEIVDKATGTVYPIVTDANGHYSTATDDTIWTGKEQKQAGLGHLAYGEYTLREKPCAANAGYELAAPIDFKIEQNNVVLNLGKVVNHKPLIATKLTYQGIHAALAKQGVELTDTITYTDFTRHKLATLKVHGYLVDKATGQKALDDHGNEIVVDTTVVVNNDNGQFDITYKFDAETLGGKTFVSFVEISDDGAADPFVSEKDLNNADQTIQFPTGHTTALDENGTHVSLSTKTVTIKDTVSYKNLIPNREYTSSLVLMDKATGMPFIDADGNEVHGNAVFTPTTPDGEVVVEVTFNAEFLSTRVVAFETVTDNETGLDVFFHKDLNDEQQSVDIPKIGTIASDTKGADYHEALAEDLTMLTDEISYENLNTKYTYHVRGRLVTSLGVETGITAEATFKPTSPTGKTYVLFAFDSTPYVNSVLVVYEDIYVIDAYGNEKLIAQHNDPNDLLQSIWFPAIQTTLMGEDTNDHNASAKNTITLIDYVDFFNLQIGKEYTVTGELYDTETGDSIGVTGETTFIPATADGQVEVRFTFDASLLEGKTVVAFEDLWREGKKVATHKNLKDKNQQVNFPDLKTTLLEVESKSHTSAAKKVTLIDYVKYTNLYIGGVDAQGNTIPAKTYKVQGELLDAVTGAKIATSETVTFTPVQSDGIVEVFFKDVDLTAWEGKTVVAVERLYDENGTELAKHEDKTDEEQSVHVAGKLKTFASIGGNKTVGDTTGDVTIIDVVKYENLAPGTYEMHGILVDQATGNPINGTVEKVRFIVTKDTMSGTVEVPLTFNTKGLAKKSIVVFETAYSVGENDELTEIGEHKDLSDKDQTIDVTRDIGTFWPKKPPKTGERAGAFSYMLFAVSALAIAVLWKKRKALN